MPALVSATFKCCECGREEPGFVAVFGDGESSGGFIVLSGFRIELQGPTNWRKIGRLTGEDIACSDEHATAWLNKRRAEDEEKKEARMTPPARR